MKIVTKIFFSLAFALFLNFQGFAQQTVGRERIFDARHYIIRSKFDALSKTYIGDTTVFLKPLKSGLSGIWLDSVGMKFDSVTLGEGESGRNLQYRQTSDKIFITLDKSYNTDEQIAVRLKYKSQPKKGVYFVDGLIEDGKIVRSPQVWTQGEAEEARHWFPSYDSPDDKATTEQLITTKSEETAIANGELLGETANPDGTKTYHYKMPVVHSVYLTSMVVGKYVKVEDKYKNIPIGYYMYPGTESVAQKAYGKTPDMMRVYEELTGVDFPYNKYDQTIVANFNFGGMENITATTMADTEILAARFDYGQQFVMDLVSHELAHSWFGDLVTTKNWSNLWLNEGFASIMEAFYREKLNGREDYLRKIREDAVRFMVDDAVNKNRHALLRLNPPTDDSLFDTTTYQKGSAVLHTLREEVGNEAFWKAVNIYLNRHKFSNVETADLKRAMEEASGKDLTWFFEQWVTKAGYPQLSVRHTYNPRTNTLSLNVSQTQKIDSITPAAFTLPLDVEVKSGDKIVGNEKITVSKRNQIFNIKVNGKPTAVVFDKDEKIPLKSVKFLPAFKAAR